VPRTKVLSQPRRSEGSGVGRGTSFDVAWYHTVQTKELRSVRPFHGLQTHRLILAHGRKVPRVQRDRVNATFPKYLVNGGPYSNAERDASVSSASPLTSKSLALTRYQTLPFRKPGALQASTTIRHCRAHPQGSPCTSERSLRKRRHQMIL